MDLKTSAIIYEAPIGPLKLVASRDGIISVNFLFGQHGSKLDDAVPKDHDHLEKVKQNEEAKVNLHLDVCKKWLDAYFNGMLLQMEPPPPRPALVLPEKGAHPTLQY